MTAEEAHPQTLGRYRILGVIGRGAMGIVYKAVDPEIDRVVAIKTINLSLAGHELAEYEARFQQEIKAAGRASHSNIVTIYDVGRTDEVAYMAMEFLNGRELKDLIAEGRRPDVGTTVELLTQAAEGLAFAHRQGVVHRDLKPSNIMVIDLPDGVLAKITDFGIARVPGSEIRTMTGIVLGSPRYMSPEQVIGKPLDARSDIFSLGVVLYEALTGIAPFDGDSLTAIMYATVNTQPELPSQLNPAVPRMLDLVATKALAKSARDRYPSMREFAADLREVGRQLAAARIQRGAAAAALPPATAEEARTVASRVSRGEPKDERARPLRLASEFDSFAATVRLASLTQQQDEFRGYISETQRMRAYLEMKQAAPAAAPDAPEAPSPTAAFVAIPRGGDVTLAPPTSLASAPLPRPALLVLGVLGLAALGLITALLLR